MIGEAAALGAAIVWAIAGLLLKPLSRRYHPLALNGLRALAAASFFALVLVGQGKTGQLLTSDPGPAATVLLGTIVGLAIGESLFIQSLKYWDVSQAYAISTGGYPLVTVLLAVLFLGEKVTLPMLLGMALVVGGILLVAMPEQGFRLSFPSRRKKVGLLLVLTTIVAWGSSAVLIQAGLRGMDLTVANFIRLAGTAVLLLTVTANRWGSLLPWRIGLASTGMGILSGFLAFGLGGWLFLIALRHVGAARTTVIASTSPVFLVLLAFLFLKERAGAKRWIGVIISIIGVWLVWT